jgi:hypothetical protein
VSPGLTGCRVPVDPGQCTGASGVGRSYFDVKTVSNLNVRNILPTVGPPPSLRPPETLSRSTSVNSWVFFSSLGRIKVLSSDCRWLRRCGNAGEF